jgi:hypothetical protein
VVGADAWWSTTAHHLTSGRVDEVKAYDYALSDDEVTQIYNLRDRSACLGDSADCAGQSCQDIQDTRGSTDDGTYWIDPDGGGAFEAWCDMNSDGGGWTLIATIHPTETDSLSEPTDWFINPHATDPLASYTFVTDSGLSSFGVDPFVDYVDSAAEVSRFTLHAGDDFDQSYSWFKALETDSFAHWFEDDFTPTRVCHDPDLTVDCTDGTITASTDSSDLEGMHLPEVYGAGSDIHMRLDIDHAPWYSGICSGTGDDPDWHDSYLSHWGNVLTIWLR